MYHTMAFDEHHLVDAQTFADELWSMITRWRRGEDVGVFFENLVHVEPCSTDDLLQATIAATRLYRDTGFAIDVPIVDHCNLRCRSCAAAAPLAKPSCADVEQLRRTLSVYARLCGDAPPREVNLVGGEPTLHPRLTDVVAVVREAFPSTTLTIITNGLSLRSTSSRALDTLAQLGAHIHVSVYGPATSFTTAPLVEHDDAWTCRRCFRHSPVAFTNIGRVEYCSIPLLPNGDLCFCTVIPTAAHLAPLAPFNLRVERGLSGDVVNILNVTKEQLLRFLNRPSCPFERFCTRPTTIAWGEDTDPRWWIGRSDEHEDT